MRQLCLCLSLSLALLAGVPTATRAQATTTTPLCDGSSSLATIDGVVGVGEYTGFSTGVNASFSGMIGSAVELYVDSDSTGNLALAIDATGRNCTWGANDSVVLYIDSRAGGFANTGTFTDNADGGRAAVSGVGTASGISGLTFSTGFTADFAIVLRNDSASLFELVGGGSHVFIRSLTRSPSSWGAGTCVREVGGLSMSDLGSTAGSTFSFFATLLDASTAFRSNEYQGIVNLPVPVSGVVAVSLTDGYNLFYSYVAPGQSSLTAAGAFSERFSCFAGTGLQPVPALGQLDSDFWRVNGMSDGAMAFGDIRTTGDFARGITVSTTGGVTAYSAHSFSERALGMQPSGTDFNPGSFELRLQNTDATATASVSIAYTILVFNNADRSSRLELTYSTDGTTFTTFPAAQIDTPTALDASPSWVATARSVSIPVSVPAGGNLFIRWTGVDLAGSGSRDRIALDDIVISPTYPVCGNGVVEGAEACDAGAANGTTTCGCSGSCGYPVAGIVCGAAGGGGCDLADTCDGTGLCIATVSAAGTSCRASVGGCDVAEVCDGASPACPSDGIRAAGFVCAPAGAGACDVDDVCDGISTVCAPLVATSGVVCRTAATTCDVAESCDGASTACPADGFASASVVCRASAEACDSTETCTGSSSVCPSDGFASATVVCRASVGDCDVAESCTGAAPACPTDRFLVTGTSCRAAAGACDAAEVCDGSSAACPSDALASAGTVCGPSGGACDVVETCTGASASCPADVIVAAGTVCRPGSGVCNPAETCNGLAPVCPPESFAADGTLCDDALACNGGERCMSGACQPGTPPACGDTNLCTTDACNEPSGVCSSSPIAGCCNVAAECSDANACTTDTCTAAGGTCVYAAISDCCLVDTECDDLDFCTVDACPAPGASCTSSPITNCCHTDADCMDTSACTADTCDAGTHRCVHAPIASCCTAATDCNDGNACTTDACDTATGACTNATIVGCCVTPADCDDMDFCTAESCTGSACDHAAIGGCCHTDSDCDDTDGCTTDACDGATHACTHTTMTCDDSDPCTADSCSSDVCQHAPLCEDGGVDAGEADAGTDAAIESDGSIAIDASRPDAGGGDAGARDGGARDGGFDGGEPTVVTDRGCGCRAAGPRESASGLVFFGLVLGVLGVRRRRGSRRGW